MARKKKKLTLEGALVPVEEQPYEVPGNWCWVLLSSVAEWGSGGTPSRKNKNYYNGTIPWIKTGELNDGYIYDSEEKITEEAVAHSSAKIFPSGSVLIAMYGATIGKTAILGIPATTNQACACARCNECLDNKFLFYYLRAQKDLFIAKGKGGAQPNISQEIIKSHPIPLPPLAEQQRIVEQIENLFSKLDEAKEKLQVVLDSVKSRKEAVLIKALDGCLTEVWRQKNNINIESWCNKKIGEVSDVKGGKRVPKGMSLVAEDTGHPYIKAGNLKKGTVIDDSMQYVPEDVLEHIKNYTVKAGDVYITNVGACIGDCGVIPVKYDGANLTENAVKMTNLRQCDNQFLAYYLASNHVQRIIKGLTASATLGKLSISNIKGIEIRLPKLEEQQEIVKIIKSIFEKEDRIYETTESIMAEIDLMKKTILTKAFRGELGTNNPEEESSIELLKNMMEEE